MAPVNRSAPQGALHATTGYSARPNGPDIVLGECGECTHRHLYVVGLLRWASFYSRGDDNYSTYPVITVNYDACPYCPCTPTRTVDLFHPEYSEFSSLTDD
jgi:hypothetical protein